MARALVVPSRAESMPYVVLEAIAAGLPIVATSVGGMPEIFGPRADELVPPGDAAALAAAIDHMLADPARPRATPRRGAMARPRFHIDAMQEQVEGCTARSSTARRRHRAARCPGRGRGRAGENRVAFSLGRVIAIGRSWAYEFALRNCPPHTHLARFLHAAHARNERFRIVYDEFTLSRRFPVNLHLVLIRPTLS